MKEGITEYTHCKVDIYFPNSAVMCQYCPLLETYARKQCRRTGEYIVNDKTFGYYCPLKKMEVNDDTGEITENPVNA